MLSCASGTDGSLQFVRQAQSNSNDLIGGVLAVVRVAVDAILGIFVGQAEDARLAVQNDVGLLHHRFHRPMGENDNQSSARLLGGGGKGLTLDDWRIGSLPRQTFSR